MIDETVNYQHYSSCKQVTIVIKSDTEHLLRYDECTGLLYYQNFENN